MPNYKTGGDLISGDRFGDDEGNAVKNHFYGAVFPTNAVAGVLFVYSVDDRVYVYDGAAWILQSPNIVGAWTPTITFGGAAVDVTYDADTGGRYVRLGDWVTLSGWLFLSNKGSSNGDAKVEGLPFTCRNLPANFACPSLRLENISFANQHTSFILSNTKHIWLQEVTEAGNLTQLTDANFANNSTIIISVSYEIEV